MTQYEQSNFFRGLVRRNPEMKEYFRNLIPDWIPKTIPTRNYKKILLDMARRGEPRPECYINGKHNPLYKTFMRSPNSDFNKHLKTIAPSWFIEKKPLHIDQLFQMAKNGESCPKKDHKLYVSFSGYTRKTNKNYKPEFTKKIKKIAPQWFIIKQTIGEQLLLMAKNGEPKPAYVINGKHNPLAQSFKRYTTPSNKLYKPKIHKQLQQIAPDWFKNKVSYRDQITQMAENGEPKPRARINGITNPMYASFQKFTTPGLKGYKKDYDVKIRKLAPHWWEHKCTYSEQLLQLAGDGAPKPKDKINGVKNPMYNVLIKRTSPTNKRYNKSFTLKIQQVAPHWFDKRKKNHG